MKEARITVDKLATDAHCCPATISGLRQRDDWRSSELIQMSNLTPHNFILDLLPTPLEGMVPASTVEAMQVELNEQKEINRQQHDEIIALKAKVETLKELLDKEK